MTEGVNMYGGTGLEIWRRQRVFAHPLLEHLQECLRCISSFLLVLFVISYLRFGNWRSLKIKIHEPLSHIRGTPSMIRIMIIKY